MDGTDRCQRCGTAEGVRLRTFTDAGGSEREIGRYCAPCLNLYLIDVFTRSSLGKDLTPMETQIVSSPFCWCGEGGCEMSSQR
jgi:hypothetical protein